MIEKVIEQANELRSELQLDQELEQQVQESAKVNENMTRVNIRISKQLHAMYKAESERTGISMSILMYKDLEQVRQQKFVMEMLPTFMNQITELQEMARKQEERNEDAERSDS